MYRSRLWTMRQFAGFGSAEDTNERFHYLLAHGVTGLSTAFDMPTLMGRDSDDPLSRGEVGREGVAVDTIRDMEILFDKIPVDEVTTSMTINGPASIVWAMYLAAAEKRGFPLTSLGGTIQNDCLKEYIAQHEWIVPERPAMDLVIDTFRFCSREVPKWNTISVSGYHIREAGSTAIQELAFTLIDGLEYVKWGVAAGLDVNDFVPRISFFFDVHNDFFEEIAKFRAARRIWAREIERRYHPTNQRALKLRTHAQTAGVSLTAQQPYNNVVRVALQALAGGARRHAVAPHELARRDLRAPDEGSGDARAAHAAGDRARVGRRGHRGPARRLLLPRAPHQRDGGGLRQVPRPRSRRWAAWSRRSSAATRSARSPRRRSASRKRSRRASGRSSASTSTRPRPSRRSRCCSSIPRWSASRSSASPTCAPSATRGRWREAMDRLRDAAKARGELMPEFMECARANASVGEQVQVLKEVFGVYHDPGYF